MGDPERDEAWRRSAVACLDGLYGFALSLSRDATVAEDLVQETYLRALKARHKAGDDGLRSWLFVILHNVWRNELRRRRPDALGDDAERLPDPEADPHQRVDRVQRGSRLMAAIDALPDAFREVLLLRCVEGFSYREMAEIVGCPAGTVMSRIARARGLLRQSLGPARLEAQGGALMAFSCESARRLLSPYLDGELVGEERSAFEAHVGACEPCRHALKDEEAVLQAVNAALPRPRAPEALRARVLSLFPSPARPSRPRAALVAAGLLMALAAGYALRRGGTPRNPSGPASDLVAFAADTHLRFIRGQLPLEVGSERPEVVSGWFSGRVPFSLALPDYPVGPGESKPYRLLGGRLVSFRGEYAAYLAYRMEERPISLLVTSSQVQPEGGDTVKFASLVFHQESVQGLKIITWTDKGLTYALASDLSVGGERSCLVCHGSPEERRRIERFPRSPQA